MNSLPSLFVIVVIFLISGCSGNENVESLFTPDPNLESSSSTSQPEKQIDDSPQKKQLPLDFPSDIPIYQSAQLISIDNQTTTWESDDPLNLILNYYQKELTSQQWDIAEQKNDLIVAYKKSAQRMLNLSFSIEQGKSKFIIKPEKILSNSPTKIDNSSPKEITEVDNQVAVNSQVTPSLQQLINLGIIPAQKELNAYQSITRREYASWLVKSNNILYGDTNSKLIRLANPNSKPIFTDIPADDPDFAVIQGLAEAGLIPSSLTQNTDAIAFNPDKALIREDLIAWKVSLDYRQNLPQATLDNIKETWGFQDASQINPETFSELYIDWQNGENANVRKAFGYIALFQPQKVVTYEEAAEVLSSFGYQGDINLLTKVEPQ